MLILSSYNMEFEFSAFISIVASLFLLEILLSVDNALVNASLAEDLPPSQRLRAMRHGIIYGAVFRLVALIFASLIIHNVWIKTAGALYLIFLAINHLGKETPGFEKTRSKKITYRSVVLQIAVANIVFGIDNVVSAVGLSSNLIYVITGVMIGIATILLISQLMLRVVERYPSLTTAAYNIVGLVGTLILIEEYKNIEIAPVYKFLMIASIIGFTIWYEHSRTLRRLFGPIFRRLQLILGFPADVYQIFARALKRRPS